MQIKFGEKLIKLMLATIYINDSKTMKKIIAIGDPKPRSGSFFSRTLSSSKIEISGDMTKMIGDSEEPYPLELFQKIISLINENNNRDELETNFTKFVSKTGQLISHPDFKNSKNRPEIVRQRLCASILTLILMAHTKEKKLGKSLFCVFVSNKSMFSEFTALLEKKYSKTNIIKKLIENNDYLAIAFLFENDARPTIKLKNLPSIEACSEAQLIVDMAMSKHDNKECLLLIDYLCEIGSDPKLTDKNPGYNYYKRIESLLKESKGKDMIDKIHASGFGI